MNTLADKYLGVGLKYPMQFDTYGKGVTNSGLSQVGDDLKVLFSTPVGSRYFLPEWGSRVNEALMEPNDEIVKSLLRTFVEDAITQWERRVKFVDMEVEFTDDRISMTVMVKVLQTNKTESFVYPFYRELKY